MSFLIRNPIVQEQYDITFAYRKHKMYQDGLKNEYKDIDNLNFLHPVLILSNATLFYKLSSTKLPRVLIKLFKVPIYALDKMGIYFLFNLFSHCITLTKTSPDIIHINNGGYPGATSCNAMVVAARLFKIKNIVYQVNNIARKQTGSISKLYDRFVNNNVSLFITASNQAKEVLVKERKFDSDKIKVIPNTIKTETSLLSRAELLESLNIPKSDFIICNVAFLSKRKGQKYLINAICQIKSGNPEIYNKIRLLLVGSGEEEQNLKNYAHELGLEEHVYFLGYQNNSVDYIEACDLFVLPSIADEDMPLVVLTAMNKAKTILATDFFGMREEIENGVSGILVSPNTENLSESLTNKIVELFYNRNSSFGAEAQKRFNKLFSDHIYGTSIVNIYNTIIGQNKSK